MKQRTYVRVTISSIIPILCSVFLAATIAAPVGASPPGDKNEPERQVPDAVGTEAVEPSVVADDGKRVVVDPETGEIVARLSRQKTDALSAPLANALNRSTEGLRVFNLTNGGRGVHLEGRFQHAFVVRMKADGSFETVCVNHSPAAEGLLKRRSTAADSQPQDK